SLASSSRSSSLSSMGRVLVRPSRRRLSYPDITEAEAARQGQPHAVVNHVASQSGHALWIALQPPGDCGMLHHKHRQGIAREEMLMRPAYAAGGRAALLGIAFGRAVDAQQLDRKQFNVVGTWSFLTNWQNLEQPLWSKDLPEASGGSITGNIK